MIKYDSDSIYNRAVNRLSQNTDWKAIINNSVIQAMLKTNAEMSAEAARYAEYLYKESKWDTAQNSTSILAAAGMLGYKPKRQISAAGNIYISADSRIQSVATGALSTSVLTDSNYAPSWNQLTTSITDIDLFSKVVDSKGNNYVVVNTFDFPDYTNFIPNIRIIQGEIKTITIDISTIRSVATISKLDSYLYIPVVINNCEAASTEETRKFFTVTVNSSSNIEYRVVDTLLLSDEDDREVEVYNDLYNQNLFYLKFNNSTSRGPIIDISDSSSLTGITIQYVETIGDKGNIDYYETFTISNIFSNTSAILYGVNLDPITGGAPEETVADVKYNAPKYYQTNYTAGTKEAYEKYISSIKFDVAGASSQTPSAVTVYGSTESDSIGNVLPVTCISFILAGAQDLADRSTSTNPYEDIETTLNYYLNDIKSPQDNIRFVSPSYIRIALGLNCSINSESADNLSSLKSSLITYIDSLYGGYSDKLAFNRDFFESALISDIATNYDAITGTSITVEAQQLLDWDNTERMFPSNGISTSTSTEHTIRMHFNFSSIFYGSKTHPGFMDIRSGADYVMRFDFYYRGPGSYYNANSLNSSIFIADNRDYTQSSGENVPFCAVKSTQATSLWPTEVLQSSNYPLSDSNCTLMGDNPPSLYQLALKKKVYSDTEFQQLVQNVDLGIESTRSTYQLNLGTIDDYLIYFSSNYDTIADTSTIGSGYIELTFEPLWAVLQKFATVDSTLKEQLQNCSLQNLKCGTGDVEEFSTFISIVRKYVDIYVCMRPVDKDLYISKLQSDFSNSILYIDDIDTSSSLANSKTSRMISVELTSI